MLNTLWVLVLLGFWATQTEIKQAISKHENEYHKDSNMEEKWRKEDEYK